MRFGSVDIVTHNRRHAGRNQGNPTSRSLFKPVQHLLSQLELQFPLEPR